MATRAIYGIRAIVEDCRANTLGGILLAFQLFETWLIPRLLAGAEVWYPLPKKALKAVNDLCNKFLKVTLGLGMRGNHIGAMYWFTKTMTMEN